MWEERPELKRLLETSGYDVVVVWKFDRISRDGVQQVIFGRLLRQRDVKLFSTIEGEQQDGEMGELITFIIGTVGRMQKKSILLNSLATKKKLRNLGLLECHGQPLYGYIYDKKTRTRETVPEQAAVMVRAFTLAAEGKSLREICALFNAEGIKGPRDLWKPNTLAVMLHDPSYYGEPFQSHKRELTEKRTPKGKRLDRRLTPDQWIPVGDGTPQIVERDLWQRAQIALADKKKRPNKGLRLWLRGHVFCGSCEGSMSPYTDKKGRHHYRCQRSVQPRGGQDKCPNKLTLLVSDVEDVVWTKLEKAINDFDWLSERITKALSGSQAPDYQRQKDVSQKKITTLRREIDRLVAARASEGKRVVVASIDRTIASKAETLEREENTLD